MDTCAFLPKGFEMHPLRMCLMSGLRDKAFGNACLPPSFGLPPLGCEHLKGGPGLSHLCLSKILNSTHMEILKTLHMDSNSTVFQRPVDKFQT